MPAYRPRRKRRRSIRMKEFDYTMDARWFVTICTHERKCMLGQVVEGSEIPEVQLSDMGKIVEEEILRTAELRPCVILDEYIIMPNHIHFLLEIINGDWQEIPSASDPRRGVEDSASDPRRGVEDSASDPRRGVARYAPTGSTEYFSNISPKAASLGAIIRSFKSATTKRINELRKTPGAPFWQRNYWEHGIRTDRELDRIQTYIKENPLHWDTDEENPQNLSNHP